MRLLINIRHVGLLEVDGKDFRIDKIPLKTVRPFVMNDIILQTIPELKNKLFDQKSVEHYLIKHVNSLISEAREEWLADNEEDELNKCPLPLIRIRV